MDLNKLTIIAGFAGTLLVLIVILARQKRLELVDVGYLLAAYFAGGGIPPAIYLCYYGLDPDPPSVPTKLHGFEKYVAAAGLVLLIFSVISLWSLCKKLWSR